MKCTVNDCPSGFELSVDCHGGYLLVGPPRQLPANICVWWDILQQMHGEQTLDR